MYIDRVCFRCDKKLQPTFHDMPKELEEDIHTPPDDATVWTSIGNFGSTVFDGGEFTGTRLEMYICDECLKAQAHLVYHYHVRTEVKNVEVFNPARH